MSPIRACLLSLLLPGCGPETDSAVGTCDPADIEPGRIEADLDGGAWAADSVVYYWTGETLKIDTGTADGYWLSIVAQTTIGGDPIKEAVSAAIPSEPVAVDLSGNGGWATVYPETGGTSLISKEGGGGRLTITAAPSAEDENALRGCIGFESQPADHSQTLALEGGRFHAQPSGLR